MALSNLSPITRLEKFLNKIAGVSVSISAITRKEFFLNKIAEKAANDRSRITTLEGKNFLPSVTSSDAGKVATVNSSGTWVAAEAAGSGGVTVFFEPPGEEPGPGDPDYTTTSTFASIANELNVWNGKPITAKIWLSDPADYIQTSDVRYNSANTSLEFTFVKYDLSLNTCQTIVLKMEDDYVAYSKVYNVTVAVPT